MILAVLLSVATLLGGEKSDAKVHCSIVSLDFYDRAVTDQNAPQPVLPFELYEGEEEEDAQKQGSDNRLSLNHNSFHLDCKALGVLPSSPLVLPSTPPPEEIVVIHQSSD